MSLSFSISLSQCCAFLILHSSSSFFSHFFFLTLIVSFSFPCSIHSLFSLSSFFLYFLIAFVFPFFLFSLSPTLFFVLLYLSSSWDTWLPLYPSEFCLHLTAFRLLPSKPVSFLLFHTLSHCLPSLVVRLLPSTLPTTHFLSTVDYLSVSLHNTYSISPPPFLLFNYKDRGREGKGPGVSTEIWSSEIRLHIFQ